MFQKVKIKNFKKLNIHFDYKLQVILYFNKKFK